MRRGSRLGTGHVVVTADGSGINEEIVDSVDDAGPGVEKAGDEHGERYGERFSEGFRTKLDGIRDRIGDRFNKSMADAGEQAGSDAGDRAGSSFTQRMTERVTRGDFAERIGDLLGEKIGQSVADGLEMVLAQHRDDLADIMSSNVSGNRGGSRPRPETDDADLGGRIGGLLGAGSRNNALNLFGKSIGGLITNVGRLQGLATSMFATFQKGWAEAGEGASVFQKALSGGGAAGARAMSALAAAGSAAAASIFVVVGAMSVMASVASALLAIVTALASTIVSALAGAVLVLGGAMAAAAAAAGLLTIAFTSMTDAQSALLSNAFQPLKAELTGIGQLMITQMIPYFDTWSTNLQEALFLAAPAAAAMGAAFGQAGASLTAALSGPGFQMFAQALAVWLPSITQRMTAALGSFLNGLTAVFASLLPLVNRFAGYLADVAERFSEWANSAQGQNAIVDFTERAVASLQSLWNFVREFSGFVADVLFSPEAQNFGNGMFDGLADSFERLRKRIDSGDLEKWFADAAQFGEMLWKVMVALADAFAALNNSGVLEATGTALLIMAGGVETLSILLGPLIDLVGFQLANGLNNILDPLQAATNTILKMGDAINFVLDAASKIPRVGNLIPGSRIPSGETGGGLIPSLGGSAMGNGLGVLAANQNPSRPDPFAGLNMDDLISSGNAALNATSVDSGGYKKPKEKKKWVNPYIDYANSLIEEGPSAMAKVRKALRDANKQLADALSKSYNEMSETLRDVNKDAAGAIRDATTADNAQSVTSALLSVVENAQTQAASAVESILSSARSTAASLRASGKTTVDAAQSALNSAASALASASTPKAAAQALKEVEAAEKAMDKAEKASQRLSAKAKRLVAAAKQQAAEVQAGIDAANSILAAQAVSVPVVVQELVNGNIFAYAVATLADFAAAREFVTAELEKANTKLAEAMSIRDQYKTQISDSIKAFGALTTAQAKVINGVQQALTADDITSNLQDRLTKIKAFQDNLRVLLAAGLSDDAYKQILAMGVEGGTPFVDALIAGGQGAISATNDLTSQITDVADGLGLEASNRLYQAGVDAAQGLVDGLESMAARLDAAAYSLGESIARAVRKALGIESPSKVLMGDMDYVGDGAVIGLDNQHAKVGRAARRFSDQISVSPEVAAYAASQGQPATVSGNNNDPRFRDLIVNTPTTDPMAVAMETLNEVTGRL